ncbi:hypothetical protein B0H13DRAFT_2366841 [Mycena leptocephala]|nr:hypothetical protein B0H13DRAFT_2366841 [Mycena leptocephala]
MSIDLAQLLPVPLLLASLPSSLGLNLSEKRLDRAARLLAALLVPPPKYRILMPAKKGALWKYYHPGEKQNSSHFKAYCLGCINVHRPASAGSAADPMDIDSDGEDQNGGLGGAWFEAALRAVHQLMLLAVTSIARVLFLWDDSHPVIENFREYFKGTPWNAKLSLLWMRRRSIDRSPALEGMLVAPLAALAANELMPWRTRRFGVSDPLTTSRAHWAPSVLGHVSFWNGLPKIKLFSMVRTELVT